MMVARARVQPALGYIHTYRFTYIYTRLRSDFRLQVLVKRGSRVVVQFPVPEFSTIYA